MLNSLDTLSAFFKGRIIGVSLRIWRLKVWWLISVLSFHLTSFQLFKWVMSDLLTLIWNNFVFETDLVKSGKVCFLNSLNKLIFLILIYLSILCGFKVWIRGWYDKNAFLRRVCLLSCWYFQLMLALIGFFMTWGSTLDLRV